MKLAVAFVAVLALSAAAVQSRSLTSESPSSEWSPSPSSSSPELNEASIAEGSSFDPNVAGIADLLAEVGGNVFTGDGTAFSGAVSNGTGFACSFRSLPSFAQQYFVAINNDQWDEGRNCGKCIRARCIDSRCPTQDHDVVALIADKCPECVYGAIDFSYPAYTATTGSWPNRLTVQWEFVDCAAFFQGTISIYPKDGGNQWWQAFYFANNRYPIVSATLDGYDLIRDQFGFWQHGQPFNGPATVVATDINGNSVTATIENIFAQADLGVQFPISSAAAAGK